MNRASLVIVLAFAPACSGCHKEAPYDTNSPKPTQPGALATGSAALGDWTTDAPGVRRKITLADLPPPNATKSANNNAHVVDRPDGALPKVPAGFTVELFASGLEEPRQIRTAPNGDLFLSESKADRIRILRGKQSEIFVDKGLNKPFGIAFYPVDKPQWVYVANTDSIVRFPYKDGDLKATGPAEMVYDKVSSGGHLHGSGPLDAGYRLLEGRHEAMAVRRLEVERGRGQRSGRGAPGANLRALARWEK